LSNTIIGPGILGLPWAFAQCGTILGSAMLLFFSGLSFFSLHLLSQAGQRCLESHPGEPLSFKSVCTHVGAHRVRWLVDLGLVVACLGALLSALLLIGCAATYTLGDERRWLGLLCAWFFVAMPLSCCKELGFLRFSSGLSLLMILYITVLVAYRSTGEGARGWNDPEEWQPQSLVGVMKALPVFSFCFCAHMTLLPVVADMREPKQSGVATATALALAVSFALYGVICAVGNASFVRCAGNILLGYDYDVAIAAAHVGIAIVCSCFYPLLLLPVRAAVINAARELRAARGTGVAEKTSLPAVSPHVDAAPDSLTMHFSEEFTQQGARVREGPSSPVPTVNPTDASPRGVWIAGSEDGKSRTASIDSHSARLLGPAEQEQEDRGLFAVVTAAINLAAIAVALSTRDISSVLSISGATGFATICYIAPAYLYLQTVKKHDMKSPWLLSSWALMVLGFAMIPCGIVANFLSCE